MFGSVNVYATIGALQGSLHILAPLWHLETNYLGLLQREEIFMMLKRDGAAKGIVFSQFTSMLDLVGFCLQKVASLCT